MADEQAPDEVGEPEAADEVEGPDAVEPSEAVAETVAEPVEAVAAEPRKRRRVVGLLFTVIGILVSVTLITGGFYAWRLWTTANDISRTDTLLPGDDEGRPGADAAVTGSLNYVLLGSDSREGEQGRSDVLMLAHVPPARDRVYVVSFPRDMWVEIPGRGFDKINAAYAYGGDALATRTLESLVGVRMNHAAKIDFDGFVGLTKQLGGVTVDNLVASRSGSYRWPKGEITISGEEALTYVRQRYELPNGDLDRSERQRAVVKAILAKMISMDVLANPAKFSEVTGALAQHFTVDAGFSNEAMFSTASSMKLRSADDILILQAPISGFSRSATGASIDVVNTEQLAEMATAVRTGKMNEYYEEYKDQPFAGR